MIKNHIITKFTYDNSNFQSSFFLSAVFTEFLLFIDECKDVKEQNTSLKLEFYIYIVRKEAIGYGLSKYKTRNIIYFIRNCNYILRL